ncbi:MAG: flagellar hook capping FlgD N-terminal domain-containing protein [Clostridium sp.]
MSVNGINPYQKQGYQDARPTGGDLTSKDVFFKILSAELSNQDPLKGKDGTEYVAQLAQFTALEQSQQLYTSVNRLLMSQSVTEGGMMIGKEVEFGVKDKDGTYKTEKGIITSVKIEAGQVYLFTKDDKKYALEQSVGFKEVTKDKPIEVDPVEKPKTEVSGS